MYYHRVIVCRVKYWQENFREIILPMNLEVAQKGSEHFYTYQYK